MMELSLQTINIIAYSKILSLVTFVFVLLIIQYKNKSWLLSLITGLSVSIFYLILSWPLQKMWWGNNGDEIFIVSFLSQVLSGNPLYDFYYHGLPTFYPPLYFWITGLISRLFSIENAINASKLGVTATFFLWFVGIYFWQKIYWHYIKNKTHDLIEGGRWFWFVTPLVLFFLIDFNDIILKPYETLPALALALLIGMIAEALLDLEWTYRHYLFFGISGGILFLSYYFWWFMAVPALFVMVLLSDQKKKGTIRVLGVGVIMFLLSSIYLIPLFLSYLKGIENWQAFFFIPKDFSTFLPFIDISWRTPLVLAGILGLIIYHDRPFVKANIFLLISGYVYQFISIILYVSGGKAIQAAKPFLFFGTASIAVGCGYLLINIWRKYVATLSLKNQKLIGISLLIFSLPFWPMTKFIDDFVVRNQIEKDLTKPSVYYLALKIKENVPDYLNRIWLSSGIPEINAYLLLHYYIAHNPHFSHPASKYSERLEMIRNMSRVDSQSFAKLIDKTPINTLLLYKQKEFSTYPFFFWADNYPNGGEEMVIEIPRENFTILGWTKKYEDSEWIIYAK